MKNAFESFQYLLQFFKKPHLQCVLMLQCPAMQQGRYAWRVLTPTWDGFTQFKRAGGSADFLMNGAAVTWLVYVSSMKVGNCMLHCSKNNFTAATWLFPWDLLWFATHLICVITSSWAFYLTPSHADAGSPCLSTKPCVTGKSSFNILISRSDPSRFKPNSSVRAFHNFAIHFVAKKITQFCFWDGAQNATMSPAAVAG
jgi:hypothetical protein